MISRSFMAPNVYDLDDWDNLISVIGALLEICSSLGLAYLRLSDPYLKEFIKKEMLCCFNFDEQDNMRELINTSNTDSNYDLADITGPFVINSVPK